MPAMLLALVTIKGWDGFRWDFPHSGVPVVAVFVAVGTLFVKVLLKVLHAWPNALLADTDMYLMWKPALHLMQAGGKLYK